MARRNKASHRKLTQAVRYSIEALERRLFLDATPYAYHIQPSPANVYSFSVSQTVAFSGKVINAAGDGIAGVTVTASDGFQEIDHPVATTDTAGNFVFTSQATRPGIVAVEFDGTSTAGAVAPERVHYNITSPTVAAYPFNADLPLTIGPATGILDGSFTDALSSKSVAFTTPATTTADQFGHYFEQWLVQYGEDLGPSVVVNTIECIAGSSPTAETAFIPCEAGALTVDVIKEAVISVIQVAVEDSSLPTATKTSIESGIDVGEIGTALIDGVKGLLDEVSVQTQLYMLSPGTISDLGSPDATDWNTATNSGTFSIAIASPNQNGEFVFAEAVNPKSDTLPPTASISYPANGSTVSQNALNAQHAIDVTYSDSGGSGLNASSILDYAPQLSLSGPAAEGVTLGTPSLLAGTASTYQYPFTGTFAAGSVTLNILPSTFYDNVGNPNASASYSFTVGAAPLIASVSPTSLVPVTLGTTQLLTINGSGFSALSTLTFTDTFGNVYSGRVPTFNNGQLQYNVSVGEDLGQWTVQVVNPGGASSTPYPFFVADVPAVSAPTFSPNGGSFSSGVQVTLTSGMPDAAIYYTLDGSQPTIASDLYTGPFTLTASATVNAQAFATGYPPSAMATKTFAISSPQPSIYLSANRVVLSDAASSADFLVSNAVANSAAMNFTLSSNASWLTGLIPGGSSSGPTVVSNIAFNVSAFAGPGYRSGTITISAPGALNNSQSVQVIQGSDPYSHVDLQLGNVFLSASPGGTPIPDPVIGQQVYVNFSDNLIATTPGYYGGIFYVVSQNDFSEFDSEVQSGLQVPSAGEAAFTLTDPEMWTVAPGQNTFQVQVDGSDALAESNVDNNTATLTFTAAPVPALSVGNSTATTVQGVDNANFIVSLSAPVAAPVTVNYSTADGTAIAGINYLGTSGQLTFTPGETAQLVQVPVIGGSSNSILNFTLALSNATNAPIAQGQGLGTILAATPPNAPTNISPVDGSIATSLTPTFQASSFSDPAGSDTQAASEWVLTRVSDGALIHDTGTDTSDLTSWTPPAGVLSSSTAYDWRVRYEGDQGNWSSYSTATTFTTASGLGIVMPIATTTSVLSSSSDGTSTYGHAVTFTATVTPSVGSNPTGTVQFEIDGENEGLPVPLSNGTATYTVSLGASRHSIAAVYSGDGNFTASLSGTLTQNVAMATPMITWSMPVAITYGTALGGTQLDASCSVPGTFLYTPSAGTSLGTGNSQTLTVTFMPTDAIDYASATATTMINVTQTPTSTLVTSSSSTPSFGQVLTFTGTVTPGSGKTGTVQFQIDGNNVGNPVAITSNTATYTTSSLGIGSHSIVAIYSGDGNFASSTSAAFIQIVSSAVALTFAQQPSNCGAGVPISPAVTVAVEDSLNKVVTNDTSLVTLTLNGGSFADGGTTESVNAVSGIATFSNLVINAAGSYTLIASDGILTPAIAPMFRVYSMNTLASFNGTGGSNPWSALAMDSSGNLFGTTQYGGTSNYGTVFEIPYGTTSIITVASFNGTDGAYPQAGVTIDSSGNLFGTASDWSTGGNVIGAGTVFEIVHGTNTITTIASFNNTNGYDPIAGVTLDASGDLFGATATGGLNDDGGTIFEIAHGTNAITVLSNSDGSPQASLTLAPDGNLFGTTYDDGGRIYGTVYEILIANGTARYNLLDSFNGANGSHPVGSLTADSNGDLFGTTSSGGANGDGTVFEIPNGTNAITLLASFNGSNAEQHETGLTLDSNGDLFGTTQFDGESNYGSVFEIPNGTTTITTLASFNGVNGGFPIAGLTLDSSGNLFGTTEEGGASGYGTVFELATAPDLYFASPPVSATAGGTLGGSGDIQVAVQFPWGTTLTSDSSTVTLTLNGGMFANESNTATAVAVNGVATFSGLTIDVAGAYTITASDGTDISTTSGSFNIIAGAAQRLAFTQPPAGALAGAILSPVTVSFADSVYNIVPGDASLVTLTLHGGTFADGGTTESVNAVNGVATFSDLVINTAGNYTLTASDGTLIPAPASAFGIYLMNTLANFNGDGGTESWGAVTRDSSGNLFGTTHVGGAGGYGIVFEISQGSASITTLASFDGTNGAYPQAGLTLDSYGDLFGTTDGGGDANGDGTVFEIAHGTTVIDTLANFNNSNGSDPVAGVTLDSSGNLFGVASSGGASGYGTVFEIAHGMTAIVPLVSFNGTNGETPYASLAIDSSGNLFGTTNAGGASGYGTVFEIAHGTTSVTTLASLSGTNGANPTGVTVDSNGNLFGATYEGGVGAGGTIFEIAHGTTIIATLASFNGANGANPNHITLDSNGNIFGTTQQGGASNDGTVFELAHGTTAIATLASFNGANGANPRAGAMLDSSGNLFGTTELGGSGGGGAVVELAPTAPRLSFPTPLASTTAGNTLGGAGGVQVAVQYSWGNTVTTDTSTITLTLSSGTFVSGLSTTTAVAINGIATFSGLAINAAGAYTLTAGDGADTGITSGSFNIVATPVITWANPTSIPYGTPLGASQLDASTNVPGTFVYTPIAGTILARGNGQTLSVTFTPTDTVDYTGVTASAMINVTQATPTITWPAPAAITYGTALSPAQLDATGSVAGTFVYTPAAGTILHAGTNQTLSVTFTPTDAVDYSTATATTSIDVTQAMTPTIAWANPAIIAYGAALSGAQLDASDPLPGTFVYTPASGTVLHAGSSQTLSVTFTPTDAVDYSDATTTTIINVLKATPTVTWAALAAISYGTALSSTQLDASSPVVAGTFAYTPAAGAILHAGSNQTMSVTFTPTDAVDYSTTTATATINVLKATPTITWTPPVAINYGSALSATQLDATSPVAGTFVYTPAAGTILHAGSSQTLSVTFTPTDAADYTSATATNAITVKQAVLNVTAKSLSRTYNTANPSLTYTLSGFVNGDTASVVSGAPSLSTSALTTSAPGVYPITVAVGTLAAGNYTFNSINGNLTVNAVATTIAVTSSGATVFGQSVKFTATVSAASGSGLTGTVQFQVNGTNIGSPVTLSGGKASYATTALSAGTQSVTAIYSGNTDFAGSESNAVSQTIGHVATSTTLTASAATTVFGQSVTFTAKVVATAPGSGTPTGTVTFKDGSTVLKTVNLVGGVGTFADSSLTVANHTITAVYSGDANFTASTSKSLSQIIKKAATTTALATSAATIAPGQPLTLTATIKPVSPGAGAPTGTVTFKSGTTVIGTMKLSAGKAIFVIKTLAKGTDKITATYGDDANFLASVSTAITQVIS